MQIRPDILQKIVDLDGKYLIVQRFINGFYRRDDEWETLFISPNVPRKFWDKKITDMSYADVEAFANQEVYSNIHLGNTYPPFQHGMRYGDFINVTPFEGSDAFEFIVECHVNKITDYYKVLELMKLRNEQKK